MLCRKQVVIVIADHHRYLDAGSSRAELIENRLMAIM